MLKDATDAQTSEVETEEEGPTRLSPAEIAHERRVERGRQKQLTLEIIREEFRDWLMSEHNDAWSELRRKRDETKTGGAHRCGCAELGKV